MKLQEEFLNLKSIDTAASLEGFAPTTKGTLQEMVGMNTPEKSSLIGIGQRIKNGEDPAEVLRKAELELEAKAGKRFTLPSPESRQFAYNKACSDRDLFKLNRQPFIFPGFTPEGDFYLSQGLTLIGAMSGNGKSTAAANVLSAFLDYKPNTTALVLSNEEATDAILHRTACIQLKKPYMKFHNGNMMKHEETEVRELAQQLLSRIIVVNDPGWDSACLEDVQGILEGSASQGVNMILIDYLQTITKSHDSPEMETFKVLKKFGSFIRDYGRRSSVPVVVFCQLNPKSSAAEFQNRVQNDKTIFNDAFNVVEISPNPETKLTDFTIHKQRFGTSQGAKVSMAFNCGWYEQIGGGL